MLISRFGKLGVVWSADKVVDVEVNGVEVPGLAMRLDPRGKGYFAHGDTGHLPSTGEYLTLCEVRMKDE